MGNPDQGDMAEECLLKYAHDFLKQITSEGETERKHGKQRPVFSRLTIGKVIAGKGSWKDLYI